ncbi:MAG: hypothetical protein SGPRY_014140, partial [Prymnesium sp.]
SINARFRREPYHVHWPKEGGLANAGVLLHVFDSWEEHDTGVFHGWRADVVMRPLLSTSLIFAHQRAPSRPHVPIPIYSNGYTAEGVILRPGGSTRILCGTASDTGTGACKSFCPSVKLSVDDYEPRRDGRDGCGGSWRPEDFGTFLYRSAMWQREVQAPSQGQMDYNEIVVDGAHWNGAHALRHGGWYS